MSTYKQRRGPRLPLRKKPSSEVPLFIFNQLVRQRKSKTSRGFGNREGHEHQPLHILGGDPGQSIQSL